MPQKSHFSYYLLHITYSLLLLFSPFVGQRAFAQTDALQSLLENCIDEESEEEMELLYEHLSEIAANPININNVTESQDQLKELLFLSPEQVDDIVEYVVRYGPVRSKSELMMIPSLDINTRQLLSSLITLGESDRQQRTAAYYQALQGDSTFHFPFSTLHFPLSNKSELTASIKIPFYKDKNADKYNGSNLKHWLRGTYNINSHLKVGFLASQDAGEPFFFG